MRKPLLIDIITIFPGMLHGVLGESMLKRAEEMRAAQYRIINLRDFTTDRHRTSDDRTYGGGPGMIMKPEPFFKSVESVRTSEARIILLTPQGRRFDQAMAEELSRCSHLILLCGHYEGVDERVREIIVTDEISIGDYILTNGTVAATVVVDAVVRLLPDVLGGEGATENESFSHNMLEYPQYTRPEMFRNMTVPEVLLSGNHAEIKQWRMDKAARRTSERRPDLLNNA